MELNPNTQSGGLVQVVIHSIGTLHPDALDILGRQDCLYYNVGDQRFRNPHADPAMRELTGLDDVVRDHVLQTPGMMPEVEKIAESAKAVLYSYANRRRRLVHVVVACKGGRHRSVAAAEAAAEYLRTDEIHVEVEHHHVQRPVVQK
ncbi:RapZ C-terminal domain-containing protein [Kitasatospora sp. NPDC001574]